MSKEFIFKILGIDKDINECSQEDLKSNPVRFRIINISYFDKEGQKVEKVGVAINSKQFGYFEKQPLLPIGTEGSGNLLPALSARVNAVLPKYNQDINIGVVDKYDFQHIDLQQELCQLTIDLMKDDRKPNPYNNPNPEKNQVKVVKIGDKILGKVDKESIPLLAGLGMYNQGSTFDAVLTRYKPYTKVIYLEINPSSIPRTIVAPKLGQQISTTANESAKLTINNSNSGCQDIIIEKVESHYWHQTKWNGDVVELKICDSDLPVYEGYHPVKVYNKILGLIPKNTPNLPKLKIFTACLITDDERVIAIPIDVVQKPEKAIQGYSRPLWESELIELAGHLGINTKSKNNNLQVVKYWDYTFIYSEQTETLYLISSRENRGKLYQARKHQPVSICNLSLDDIAFFHREYKKIQNLDKNPDAHPQHNEKRFKFFTDSKNHFTSDCLQLIKIYDQKYLYDWYVENGYLEDNIEMSHEFEPSRLREWLKRNNISEDESLDKAMFKNYISDYVYFVSWLARGYQGSDLTEIEDYYDNEKLKLYKQCCEEEEKEAEECAYYSNYDIEDDIRREKEFERRYGHYGCLQDGEYLMMRYLEGLDTAPEELESSDTEELDDVEEMMVRDFNENPCIVVSCNDDESHMNDVYKLWCKYAAFVSLKTEQHIKIHAQNHEGYYPKIYTILVSGNLLRAIANDRYIAEDILLTNANYDGEIF